jgi:hypothetical protein
MQLYSGESRGVIVEWNCAAWILLQYYGVCERHVQSPRIKFRVDVK